MRHRHHSPQTGPSRPQRRISALVPQRRIYVVLIVLGVALIAAALQPMTITIPITTVLRGEPGTLFLVGEAPAPAGAECVAELEGRNNKSTHPDSDILVGPVTFTDVENGTFQAAGLTFISDGTNRVYVRLGADGVFSAGFLLEVTCNPPTTTTTTTEPIASTSSTTTTPTPQPPTTTTTAVFVTTSMPSVTTTPSTLSPPPEGGIETGGGACDDGACDGSLSPLLTWIGIGAVWFALSGLAWAAIAYPRKGDTE